jgi:hypothetical protein
VCMCVCVCVFHSVRYELVKERLQEINGNRVG